MANRPPPLPPKTSDMMRPSTLPRRYSYNDQLPPPLPPRPGSSSTLSRLSSSGGIERAPPLPPRPPRSTSTPSVSSSFLTGRTEYDTIPLSLSDLTKDLTTKIPSCIIVKELSNLHGAPSSLAVGDVINLHFSKSTRVVNVLSISGMSVLIPVNSPMLCSVLYDPVDDIDRAQKGYIFGSGSQLLSASPLPQFIGVLKGSRQTKMSSTFTDGEILVLKGPCKNGKFLKCQTIPDGDVKYIHDSTAANFTTNPDKIKVHLSEVVKHLEYQIKVKFYPQDMQLQQYMRKPYTLMNVESQKSVIATYHDAKQLPVPAGNADNQYILEIFVNAPLKCDPLELTKTEKRDVIRKSKKLFESFSPSCVSEIVADVPAAVKTCQNLLFSTVGEVHGTLSRSQPLMHTASIVGTRAKHVPFLVPNTPARNDDWRYTPSAVSVPTPQQRPPPQHNPQELTTPQPNVVREDPYSLSPGNLYDIDDIYDDFSRPLEDLTVNEVLLLLENIGLSQYRSIFQRERISGSLLQGLDEEMLEHDFGIVSRLHRMKIMRIILGQDPINLQQH